MLGINSGCESFNSAAKWLGHEMYSILSCISPLVRSQASEIRLRAGCPVTVMTGDKMYFLNSDGSENERLTDTSLTVSQEGLEHAYHALCSYSVHSHQNTLSNGFITVEGGHRAGICGTAVTDGKIVTSVRNITSINMRIAREISGAADFLFETVLKDGISGTMIVGAPMSGKTTILRDTARRLSSGKSPVNVTVVDERGEIGGVYKGKRNCNLGVCCDLMDGYPKAEGIMQAVRVLSPKVIIFDEAGTEEECRAVSEGLNSGVCFICACHGGSIKELKRKRQIRLLLETGAFENIVLLDRSAGNSKVSHRIFKEEEILNA